MCYNNETAAPSSAASTMASNAGVHLKSQFDAVRTLGVIYSGGKAELTPCGTRVVCLCEDEIHVVDRLTGKPVRTFSKDDETLTCFAVSPDSKTLVASTKESLRLVAWDLATGEQKREMKAHRAPVLGMAFHDASDLVATASADRTVMVRPTARSFS